MANFLASLFSNKNIPAGEGGILSFNKKYNYKDVNSLKSHGMSILTQDRYKKSSLKLRRIYGWI